MGLAKARRFLQGHQQVAFGFVLLVWLKQAGQVKMGLGGVLRIQLEDGLPGFHGSVVAALGFGHQGEVSIRAGEERVDREGSLGIGSDCFPVLRFLAQFNEA